MAGRAQRITAQIDVQRERTDAVVSGARNACAELALRRGILAEQLEVISRPLQVVRSNEKGEEGSKGEGKMHLTLSTASVGMDGVGGMVVGGGGGGGGGVEKIAGRTKRSGSVTNTRRSLMVTTGFG